MIDYNSKYTGVEVEALLDAANGKQDAIEDLDVIRAGAAKGATALQSVPSEYVTETELSNKGYATTSQLDNKVDKVSGKQLSTEDFTTALKTKLQGLINYDDTAISDAVASLQAQINTLVSGNASSAIESFNEIIAFLDGVQDTQDLSSIIASIEQQIAGKMDKVTLATVATSGSYNDLSNKPTIPAEQVNADWNATSGKAQILNKPTIPSAVTESTVSGWGFTKNTGTYSKPSTGIPKSDLASAVQTSLGKADTALQSVPNTYATNAYVDNKLATTLEFYRTRFTFQELVEAKNNGGSIQEGGKAELVQAITLGKTIVMDYDTIAGVEGKVLCNATLEGDEILLQIVFGNEHIVVSTFTDGDTIYSDDITYNIFVAESDFNDTIEGLNANKQDTLVSGTNIKTINGESIVGSGNITISGGSGTITGVSANGTSVATSGVANIPAASTSAYGVTKLSSATNSTSTTLAATASAVKANSYKGTVTGVKINGTTKSPTSGTVDLGTVITAHQDISGKQDKLVSGTNIKTINGTSILGSGDITIEGGSGGSSSGSGKEYVEAPLMTEPMGTSIIFTNSVPLEPNKVFVAKKKVSSINADIISIPSDSIGAEYTIMFQTSTSELSIIVSSYVSLLWANGAIPTIEADTYYELSLVLNNINNTRILKAVLTPFKTVE